jgi:hypothetical protein
LRFRGDPTVKIRLDLLRSAASRAPQPLTLGTVTLVMVTGTPARRWSGLRRQRQAAIPTVALALAAAVVGCGSGYAGPVPARESSAGAYGVFRRAPRPGDTPPAFGAQTPQHLARLIAGGSSADAQAWGEIERGRACVYAWASGFHPPGETPGGGCVRAGCPVIAASGMSAPRPNSSLGPDAVLAGLLPDGIRSVQLHFDDGSTRVVAIRDNGFALRAPSRLRRYWLLGRPGASQRSCLTA